MAAVEALSIAAEWKDMPTGLKYSIIGVGVGLAGYLGYQMWKGSQSQPAPSAAPSTAPTNTSGLNPNPQPTQQPTLGYTPGNPPNGFIPSQPYQNPGSGALHPLGLSSLNQPPASGGQAPQSQSSINHGIVPYNGYAVALRR